MSNELLKRRCCSPLQDWHACGAGRVMPDTGESLFKPDCSVAWLQAIRSYFAVIAQVQLANFTFPFHSKMYAGQAQQAQLGTSGTQLAKLMSLNHSQSLMSAGFADSGCITAAYDVLLAKRGPMHT